MQIKNEDNASGGRYVAELDGHQSEMTFSRTNAQLITIDHTGVPDALRGKGVGQALAAQPPQVLKEEGRRDDRWPAIERETVLLEHARTAAGPVEALQ